MKPMIINAFQYWSESEVSVDCSPKSSFFLVSLLFRADSCGCFDFEPEFVSSSCCQLVSAFSCSEELVQFVKNSLQLTFFWIFSLRMLSWELRLYWLSFTICFPWSESVLILLLPTFSPLSPCPEGRIWFRSTWSDGCLSGYYHCW